MQLEELLGINENFVILTEPIKGKTIPARLSDLSLLKHPNTKRISLGQIDPTAIKKVAYTGDLFYSTKCLLMIDLDNKESLNDVLNFLDGQSLSPTAIVETPRGYHLLYIYSKDYTADEYLDDILKLDLIARRILTPYLKQHLPIDKAGTFLYTRSQPLSLKIYQPIDQPIEPKDLIEKIEKITNKSLDTIHTEPTTEEYQNASSDTTLEVFNYCNILKHLDETTATHTFDQWKYWTIAYANSLKVAKTSEEVENIIKTYHDKASLYPEYSYKANERILKDFTNKYGFIKISCEKLQLYTDKTLCQSCKYKEYPGTPYKYLLDSLFYDVIIEEGTKARITKRDDGFYYYLIDLNTQAKTDEKKLCNPVEVIYIIRDRTANRDDRSKLVYFKSDNQIIDFPYSLLYTFKKNKFIEALTSKGIVDTTCHINDKSWYAILKLLLKLVSDFEADKNNRDIFTIDPTTQFNYVDLGFPNYSPYFYDFMVSKKLGGHFYYSKEGDSKTYFKQFIRLFKSDEPTQLITAFTLLQFLHSEKYKKLFTLQETPIMLLIGEPGSGKTLRLITILSLWGRGHYKAIDRLYSFTGRADMTEAFISYVLPTFSIPIAFDDLGEKKDRSLSETLKTLANASFSSIRSNAHSSYHTKPLNNVMLFSVEPINSQPLLEQYEKATGASRRIILMRLQEKDNIRKNNTIRDLVLATKMMSLHHYGHINLFNEYLEQNISNFSTYHNEAILQLKQHNIELTLLNYISLIATFGKIFTDFLNDYFEASLDFSLQYFIDLSLRYFLTDIRTEDFLSTLLVNVKYIEETIQTHKIIQSKTLEKFFGADEKFYTIIEILFSNTKLYNKQGGNSYYSTFSHQNGLFRIYSADLSRRYLTYYDYKEGVASLLINLDTVLIKRKKFTNNLNNLLTVLRENLDLPIPFDEDFIHTKGKELGITYLKERLELAYYLIYIYLLILKENKDHQRASVFTSELLKTLKGSDIELTIKNLLGEDPYKLTDYLKQSLDLHGIRIDTKEDTEEEEVANKYDLEVVDF